jgi:peptidoglycan/xylan/chitin deacetylase (PgdA/CDA1 family)
VAVLWWLARIALHLPGINEDRGYCSGGTKVAETTGAAGTAVFRSRAMVAVALLVCVWLTAMKPEQVISATVPGEVAAKRPPAGGASPSPTPRAALPIALPPRAHINCAVAKCVALTFDDGPLPGTAKLLDTLAARKARATFFVVGINVAAYPGLVRRAAVEGHEIGNHSWSHTDLGRSSKKKIESEIGRTQEAVRRVTGLPPTLFRPPYGSTDAQVAAVARRHRVAQFIWSADTFDWRDRNPSVVMRRAVRDARPGGIILMHDIHATTVAAVPRILDRLAAKGYVFVTITELYSGRSFAPGQKYYRRCPEPPPATASPSLPPVSSTPGQAAGTPSSPPPPAGPPPADPGECGEE